MTGVDWFMLAFLVSVVVSSFAIIVWTFLDEHDDWNDG